MPRAQLTNETLARIARDRFPTATEIHVQTHTHFIANNLNGERTQDVYICSIEGYDLRKQFIAKSAIELEIAIKRDRNTLGDWKNFINTATEESY